MEIRQLKTFCAIAELESFTRAAHRLGISQSGISQQIGALEREVGGKLLSRSGTGVRPTSAGMILLHYAQSIIRKLDEAERALGLKPDAVRRLGALAVAYFIGCELLRIRWEEGVLGRAFPDHYPAYARRVPRYFPNPLRART